MIISSVSPENVTCPSKFEEAPQPMTNPILNVMHDDNKNLQLIEKDFGFTIVIHSSSFYSEVFLPVIQSLKLGVSHDDEEHTLIIT